MERENQVSVDVELIQIEHLIRTPEDKNPNKMSPEAFAMLVEAMRVSDAKREGGRSMLQPILVAHHDDVSYDIVDGDHRVGAAIQLGWKDIRAVVKDMSPDQVIAYRLGMNRNRGTVDLGIASAIVTELKFEGWSAADMVITGFSADEIVDLVDVKVDGGNVRDLMGDAAGTDVEDTVAPNAKPFSLEIVFATREQYTLARRKLRKAAGKGGDLAQGLMTVLGEE